MAKQPLDWHRMCFMNWSRSVEEKRKIAVRAQADFEKSERGLSFYRKQIEAAEVRGLDAFDSDRLLVKRVS